jgi:hypothetical protein
MRLLLEWERQAGTKANVDGGLFVVGMLVRTHGSKSKVYFATCCCRRQGMMTVVRRFAIVFFWSRHPSGCQALNGFLGRNFLID